MSELETANSALSNHVEELTTKCGSLMDITYELGYQNSLLREKVLQLTSQLAKKDDQLVDQGEELEGRQTEVERLQGIVVELEGEGDQGAAGQGSPPREGGSRGDRRGGCVRRPDEP